MLRLPFGSFAKAFGSSLIHYKVGEDPVEVTGILSLNTPLFEGDAQYSAVTLRLPLSVVVDKETDRFLQGDVSYRVTQEIPTNDPGWQRFIMTT